MYVALRDFAGIVALRIGNQHEDPVRGIVLLGPQAVGLDTESRTAAEGGKSNARDLILSLSVNLQEAQLLALAVDKGKLNVALRNPSDPRVIAGIPDMLSTALTDTKVRGEVQTLRQKGPVKIEGAK